MDKVARSVLEKLLKPDKQTKADDSWTFQCATEMNCQCATVHSKPVASEVHPNVQQVHAGKA